MYMCVYNYNVGGELGMGGGGWEREEGRKRDKRGKNRE